MRLYIPEIGDSFILTEDWVFELHPEHRNIDLGAHFNHYPYKVGWVNLDELPMMRNIDYQVDYPTLKEFTNSISIGAYNKYDYDRYNKACKEAENNCEAYVKWNEDNRIWHNKASELAPIKPFLGVTLPKGTILKVDRIYIRKGKSDFSSITFYANIQETVTTVKWRSTISKKKKSLRFWAKLSDCNNIEMNKL